jgi:hypothetical protein
MVFILGLAVTIAMFLAVRKHLKAMPGGQPYFVLLDTSLRITPPRYKAVLYISIGLAVFLLWTGPVGWLLNFLLINGAMVFILMLRPAPASPQINHEEES